MEKASKFISYLLRHAAGTGKFPPIDNKGWMEISVLLETCKQNRVWIELKDLEQIVNEDQKQRYTIEGSRIRANQGHSLTHVDASLVKKVPPVILFHGTAERFKADIFKIGLLPMSRLWVHLTDNTNTAKETGKRHGSPIILEIDAKSMLADGHEFFISANGVWQVKHVPSKYLKLIN